jgi:nuclear pore complex protein Nup54
MKSVQLLRNRGYSLRAEEEVLITRLLSMDRDLSKPLIFRGRLNEIWAHIQQLKDADLLNDNVGNEFSLSDPTALDPVCEALKGIGNGLNQLTAVVKEDEATVDKISKGFQRAH